MAFYKDFDYSYDHDDIVYRKAVEQNVDTWPPSQAVNLKFHAIGGTIAIAVAAYDLHKPSRQTVGPPHTNPDDPDHEEFNLVPVKVELFAPTESTPIQTWRTEGGWSKTDGETFKFAIDPTHPNVFDPWKCRITNISDKPATLNSAVGYVFAREPLLWTPLPFSLLDHTYTVILDALKPDAFIVGDTVHVSIGEELQKYFSGTPGAILGPQTFKLPDGIEGTGSMKCLEAYACTGKQLLDAMHERFQQQDAALQERLSRTTDSLLRSLIVGMIGDNIKWKNDWERRVAANYLTIHLQLSFTEFTLERDFDFILGRTDVDIADIEEFLVDVFIAFHPELQECYTLALTPAKVTGGLAETLIDLGILPLVNEKIESFLPAFVDAKGTLIGRYLGEALGRLCAKNGVFLTATADEAAWNVRYTRFPQEAVDHIHVRPGTGGGTVSTGEIVMAPPVAGSTGGVASAPNSSGESATRGEGMNVERRSRGGATSTGPRQWPAEFVVGSEQALARLKNINHIVVVMMENRSFDHMLGYLHKSRGPMYEGVKGGESNPVSTREHPVTLRRAHGFLPEPCTQIKNGPEHGFQHVPNQIAQGEMTGFAQDYENSFPGEAEKVMTYYTGEELDMYDHLAGSFAVCDAWFAAHPGPTWPNRWTTMSGTTPDLDNPSFTDPRMGFLPNQNIFDLLSLYGIDWAVFESDFSLIRTYDRYRLNTSNVKPLRNKHDPSQSLEELAKQKKLPSVIFVEPNFSDIPPLSSANDDLVPVDLRRGQAFIRRVYNHLLEYTKADDKHPQGCHDFLFLITYDEHGGFYDHVPPPGTQKGTPPEGTNLTREQWQTPVPKIHPEGADYMGVRVPAIVASPYVSAGSVCKHVFDHTSIIKTILLLHQENFTDEQLLQFGPRVNQAAHLGYALDLEVARPDWPQPPAPQPVSTPRKTAKASTRRSREIAAHADDLHETLRRIFLPKR